MIPRRKVCFLYFMLTETILSFKARTIRIVWERNSGTAWAGNNGIGWARTSGIVRARTLGENI